MIVQSPYPEVEIPPVSVPEYVMAGFSALGEKVAIIDGETGQAMTYAQLDRRIRAVAAGLQHRGIGPGDVIAIFSPNLPDYAVLFHAAALVGAISTTANPLYTPRELRLQLEDSGAVMVFTTPAFLDVAKAAVEGTAVREIVVFGQAPGATSLDDLVNGDGAFAPARVDSLVDLVVLPYSSGTTGLPKGVMLTHSNLVANMCQCAGILDLELIHEDDVILGVLPFFHIYGMLVIMNYSLRTGATVVTMPRFDLEMFLRLIQDYRVTRVNVVPPILVALAKSPVVDEYDLSSLKSIFSGAAPLGEDLAAQIGARIDCDVLQGYGLTETSPVTHTAKSHPDIRASIGRPIPNTEARVVDVDSGELLGAGQQGELQIRGPQVMKGYLNNPETTAAVIDEEGWLRTGDLAYYDDQERFFIVDRVKELIKYNAYQVAPAELEGLLLGHPAVADVAVIPVEDEETGQIPKACVVRANEISEQELMDWLSELVAPQKRIRMVEFVDSIPKSASGKILRRQLIEREATLRGGG